MDLVASDTDDVQKVLEKAYEWEHTRRLEAGKWFLATGTAALIGAITLSAKETPPAALYLYFLAGVGAFVTLAGFTAFWLASSTSARLTRVTALAAKLKEIKPFLVRLRVESSQ